MASTKKLEQELIESERNFRLLVHGITDYAIYMLSPEGIVTNWNSGAERIKGYKAKEIVGKHFSTFYTPEDLATDLPTRALAIAKKEKRFTAEGWRVRKDGSRFFASVVIDPIYENRKLIGFAKITRDVTERKEAQEHLMEVQKRLAESQRLDALGQLTGGVAHDFNNLLMIIAGNVQAIKKEVSSEKGRRSLRSIDTAAQRAASLTRQLLSFARRQSVQPQTIELSGRLNELRDMLNSGLGSMVRLDIDLADDVAPIRADPSEFETSLLNLVINARDAMPEGGTVTISARNRGHAVDIAVEDTGVGIPPDVLEKVFEPFFTTKPIGKGTGLGLSQVHGFTHQAGGTIAIESTLGKGTKVVLSMPRSEVSFAEEPEYKPLTGAGTVLLVEDNPDVAEATQGLIEQLGYRVRWAYDAPTALIEIERNGIDIVFSDIVMPGKMDGFGLARKIRQERPGLPILLVTGYSEAATKSEFPILRKPYQLHELSRELEKLLTS